MRVIGFTLMSMMRCLKKGRWGAMKRILWLCILLMGICCVFTGCKKNEKAAFADVEWTRTTEEDTEYIYFASDGGFSYSCGCGNPVNDSDLCNGYTYDDKTGTITLNYDETTDTTITEIKVKNYDGNSLELDFNGDIRKFSPNE